MKTLIEKTVDFTKIDLEGDSDYITKQFSKQAKQEGWTSEEINKVVDEAKNGDYDHLLNTYLSYGNMDQVDEDNNVEIVIDYDDEDEVGVFEHPYNSDF